MINALVFILSLISINLLIRKKDTTLFLLVILLCPPYKFNSFFDFGAFSFSNYYLFIPFVFFSNLVFDRIKTLSRLEQFYIVLYVLILVTSFTNVKHIALVPLIAGFSYLMILFYLLKLPKIKLQYSFDRFVKYALILNLIAVVYQVLFPLKAMSLLETYYFTSSRSTSIENDIDWYGHFTRYSGLFFSPLLLSSFCIVVSYYLISKKNYFYLLIALALGVSTVSKAFYANLFVLFLYFYYTNRKSIKVKVVSFFLIIIGGVFSLNYINEYFKSHNGFSSVDEVIYQAYHHRYDTSNKELLNKETIANIEKNPIIGHGYSILPEVFLGDSVLVDVLYMGGIIGLGITLFLLYKSSNNYFYFSVLLVMSLGIDYLFNIYFICLFLVGYLLGNRKQLA